MTDATTPEQPPEVGHALDASIARLQSSVRRAVPLTEDEKALLRMLIRDLALFCDKEDVR